MCNHDFTISHECVHSTTCPIQQHVMCIFLQTCSSTHVYQQDLIMNMCACTCRRMHQLQLYMTCRSDVLTFICTRACTWQLWQGTHTCIFKSLKIPPTVQLWFHEEVPTDASIKFELRLHLWPVVFSIHANARRIKDHCCTPRRPT